MKACTKCGRVRALDMFGNHKGKPFDRTSRCLECLRESGREFRKREGRRLADYQRERRNANPERYRAEQREWRAKNPDRELNYRLQQQFGISLDQYRSLLAFQGGGCGICGANEPGGAATRGNFSVDHDHSCCPGKKSCGQCIRALLCFMCNTGIGKLGDNAEGLRRALAVLENPPASRWRSGLAA